MAELKNVIYISNEDYLTLVSTGTVTINGETLTYDEDNIYITPDQLASTTADGLMSAADKIKLDSIEAGGEPNPDNYLVSASVNTSTNTLTLNPNVGNAVTFTPKDTLNTAGSTNSDPTGTAKLYLIGAGSQAANPQTYSNANVYVADSGTLYAVKTTDLSGTANNHPALIVGGVDTAAHLEVDANEIQAKATGTTTAPLYLNNDGGNTYLSGSKTYSDGTYLYSNSTKVSVEGHTHSAYVNQNAFGIVSDGTHTATADAVQDTLTITGSGATTVTVSDASNVDTITISSIDTKNTAGASDQTLSGTAKLYLIGAGTQTDGIQTYSNSKLYYAADKKLYIDDKAAIVEGDSRLTNARTPTAHASSATTYGVGTESNYGHVKLATGDMNGANNVDGVAVSKNHTHSQYLLAANYVDTKNTAGATDNKPTGDAKLFLVGAGTQTANPQTYTDSDVYIADTNELHSGKFVGPLETVITDSTNHVTRYQGTSALRKVYTGVLGVANGSSPNNNTYANQSFYFLTVKPLSWGAQWRVKYHLNIHLDNEDQKYKSSATASVVDAGRYMRGTYDCTISGANGAYNTFHFFQSQANTSYRPIYYHMIHNVTQNGFNADYGHKIGVSLTSSYLSIPTTDYSSGSAVSNTKYSRTIEVIVDEAINCEVSLNDTLEVESDAYRTDYTKLNATYYTANASSSNSAGRWINLSATTQGLYESGDDNTYTYTQQSSNYLKNGTAYSDSSAGYITGYSLVGFDKNGNALAISKRTPTATSYDTAAQQTRVYCNVGFDYTKGIRYISTSSNFAANTDMNVSTQINYSGVDFRYSDNCIASGSANELGLVNRKPVYLRGTIGTDGLFYLAPITVTYNNNSYKRAWTQVIPSAEAENGNYVYWFIGYPYYNSSYANSLYQLNLTTQSELVWYRDGTIQPYRTENTDTLDTTGSSDKSGSKLYIIGASAQATSIVTGSNNHCYIGTDNCLYSNDTKVLTGHQTIYNLGLKFNDETSAALTFDPNGAASTWTIKPSTTAGAFTVSDGTTTKTIQLAGEFTDADTKNTTGTSNAAKTDKLYLTGATLRQNYAQTYTREAVYQQNDNLYADNMYATSGMYVGNTAVVLTNDSRLSNARTPTAHAVDANTYGLGTSSLYGHVKLDNSTLDSSSTNTDGVAVGKGHKHTTSIAEDSGTNQLTLGYGKKYKLSAGSTSFIFTMPNADDTDTKNTAGSTNSANDKLYLVGAGSQATYATTYSHSEVYEKAGTLNAVKYTVDAAHTGATIQYNTTTGCLEIIC